MRVERFKAADFDIPVMETTPNPQLFTRESILNGLSFWFKSQGARFHINEQIQTMRGAQDEDFFWEQMRKAQNPIGTTLSVDHYDWVLAQKGMSDEAKRREMIGSGIRSMRGNMGIRSFRVPIRWNRAVGVDNKVDLSFYDSAFEVLGEEAGEITANVGPIKAARDPEVHTPGHVDQIRAIIPPRGSVITSGSELAKYGIDYLYQLLTELKEDHPQFATKITTIQLDNEPFNRFGPTKYLMDPQYVKETILVAQEFFPNARILLNSLLVGSLPDFIRGVSGFQTIEKFTKELLKIPSLKGKIVWGYDWYHHVEDVPSLPRIGIPDQITLANVRMNHLAKHLDLEAATLGVESEGSEIQMEPWGRKDTPGNSDEHLRYALLRGKSLVGSYKPLKVWGGEELQANLDFAPSPEHIRMGDTIARGNQMAA